MTTGYTLDKAERTYILKRLRSAADLCGFERDLLDKLEASQCGYCHGSGYAPYVGGDDDEAPCPTCGGSGFAAEVLNLENPSPPPEIRLT